MPVVKVEDLYVECHGGVVHLGSYVNIETLASKGYVPVSAMGEAPAAQEVMQEALSRMAFAVGEKIGVRGGDKTECYVCERIVQIVGDTVQHRYRVQAVLVGRAGSRSVWPDITLAEPNFVKLPPNEPDDES